MTQYKNRLYEANGYIEFPTSDPNFSDSGEGGMSVQLVVFDKSYPNDKWLMCCGSPNKCNLGDEILVGKPKIDEDLIDECGNVNVLAAITLASTKWTGYHDVYNSSFIATKENLTEEGTALWVLMENLYPGCEIMLLTFLDT